MSNKDFSIKIFNQNYSNISLATIYRNIGILLEESLIRKLKIGTLDIYETVKNKHYHYQCKMCNEIYDIDIKQLPIKINEVKIEDKTFNVIDNDLVLYGICDKCIKKL